ncbi:hypothetical protein EVAR_37735_1 [Eumeta japonica]|uniref:Uncharacterized protein n=1 Tax=Eumeta variegata TaxID=151549 RepID=A0A4C1WPT7_EUMVA|nr:hypothetical protein EVAR_37735_1 [Eumeta japonica]
MCALIFSALPKNSKQQPCCPFHLRSLTVIILGRGELHIFQVKATRPGSAAGLLTRALFTSAALVRRTFNFASAGPLLR